MHITSSLAVLAHGQWTTKLPRRGSLCCECQEAAVLDGQGRSLMCWNGLAGQERTPLTKETVAPKAHLLSAPN